MSISIQGRANYNQQANKAAAQPRDRVLGTREGLKALMEPKGPNTNTPAEYGAEMKYSSVAFSADIREKFTNVNVTLHVQNVALCYSHKLANTSTSHDIEPAYFILDPGNLGHLKY